jgi:hemerythrin superfamily protein
MAADNPALNAWLDRLREILNRNWDPIGGCPEDEYDSYMGKIASLLRDHASDEEMLAYFKWVEVENMGLGSEAQFDPERILKVIAALGKLGSPP